MMNGDWIKFKRKAKGWNQPTLAKRIGVSVGTIVRYEAGQEVPLSKKELLKEVLEGENRENSTDVIKGKEQHADLQEFALKVLERWGALKTVRIFKTQFDLEVMKKIAYFKDNPEEYEKWINDV